MKVQYSLANLNAGQQLMFSIGMTVNLMLAARDISLGVMTPGDFVMIQALFMQVAQPLHFMGTIFREVDESHVNVEELFNILEYKSRVVESPNARPLTTTIGELEFRDVQYTYTRDDDCEKETLLDQFSLKIEPGTSNAIVGPSGFGKTTIFNMIYRLLDPEKGQILIDGEDLKDLTFDSFRDQISIVPQNGNLFNDTILFNLQYGNTAASRERIEEICKKCQIHDKIMEMPQGYETHVGDLGGKLSGGEKQRILIARALLKDASIYLFDEATSSLDSYNEKVITEQIEEELRGKTVILCAHRLSSIVGVDKIHVLGGGKVVEQGHHDDLVNDPNSTYYTMWKNFLRTNQTGADEVKEEVVMDN